MNFEKVADQFGTWGRVLRPFIESEDMDAIFKFLKTRSKAGAVICPHHTDVFRAFRECNYEQLKCVIVGMDPYPWVRDGSYAADGLAFSCSHTGVVEASLNELYLGMEDDLAGGFHLTLHKNPDLSYLAHQGVLLLNASLTTERGSVGAHAPFVLGKEQIFVWDAFMKFLLNDVFNNRDAGLVFVFMGKGAQRYALEPVPFQHHVLQTEHPAAGPRNGRRWEHQHVFSRINNLLEDMNGPEARIRWFEEHQ